MADYRTSLGWQALQAMLADEQRKKAAFAQKQLQDREAQDKQFTNQMSIIEGLRGNADEQHKRDIETARLAGEVAGQKGEVAPSFEGGRMAQEAELAGASIFEKLKQGREKEGRYQDFQLGLQDKIGARQAAKDDQATKRAKLRLAFQHSNDPDVKEAIVLADIKPREMAAYNEGTLAPELENEIAERLHRAMEQVSASKREVSKAGAAAAPDIEGVMRLALNAAQTGKVLEEVRGIRSARRDLEAAREAFPEEAFRVFGLGKYKWSEFMGQMNSADPEQQAMLEAVSTSLSHLENAVSKIILARSGKAATIIEAKNLKKMITGIKSGNPVGTDPIKFNAALDAFLTALANDEDALKEEVRLGSDISDTPAPRPKKRAVEAPLETDEAAELKRLEEWDAARPK